MMNNTIEMEPVLNFGLNKGSGNIEVQEAKLNRPVTLSRSVGKLDIEFLFNLANNQYCAMFWKNGELFAPEGNVFEAKTWKGLRDRIEFKMRDADFVYFVGIFNRHKIAKVLDCAENELKNLTKN